MQSRQVNQTPKFKHKLLVSAIALAFSPLVLAGPLGGQVTQGSGSINQSGATTVITQNSSQLSLNWDSFNVGSTETVNFMQPSASSVVLNRVLSQDASAILGNLNANGQVFLINPNGILFGSTAQVNVGGLVASTLNISDADLLSDSKTFSGNGNGSVTNDGNITASHYVALLGNSVTNNGSINAQLGTVAMGAGDSATLTFAGDSLIGLQIDSNALDALAANNGLIQADGGTVLMSAGAKDSLLASVVNNTGIIQARTVENRNGTIVLLGGMAAGTTNVNGTLDASAPNGGNGGFIETSAAHVKVNDGAKITTAAANGIAGTWLIDPVDFTIAATGGDMTGATLSTNLGGGNVAIASTSGAAGTAGDINVNDTVTWSANTLTLTAQNNININTAMNGSGTAGLALEYGQANVNAGNTSTYNVNAPVNLASTGSFSTKLGNDVTATTYTIIDSLGAAGSVTTTDLQGMNGNLAGNYVLGADIDATATSTWNAGAGFTPIGTAAFTGVFDGLGHTINNLTINLPTTNNVGMFNYGGVASVIRNVGLVGGNVSGQASVGVLAGSNYGAISNSYASGGSVSGNSSVGGLVGYNYGTVSNSYATVNVSGSYGTLGGLVGSNYGTIDSSHATGNVTTLATSSASSIGGLAGSNGGTISNSYAANGTVSGVSSVGGLVGRNQNGSTISNSYATGGTVSGINGVGGLVGWNSYSTINGRSYAANTVAGATSGRSVGGLVGYNQGGTIDGSYTTSGSVVSGGYDVGGLVGYNRKGVISNSRASGSVSGYGYVGGLVGHNYGIGSIITSSHATGDVTGGTYGYVGGLVGYGAGGSNISGSHATGNVTSGGNNVGGLVGYSAMRGGNVATIDNSYATGIVSGGNYVGGLVGLGSSDQISNSHATGNVTGSNYVGGLVGSDWGYGIANSYATGTVTGSTYVGGLAGYIDSFDNSYATGNVSGADYVGGLAGWSSGIITNSHATGVVTGTGSNVGGLSGYGYGSTNSYATGNVSGASKVGGLFGYNYGTVDTSHATGTVTASSSWAGGLVGWNNLGATVSNSYATGDATGTGTVGGLVGYNGYGTISNSYALGNASAGAYGNGAGGLVGNNKGGTINTSYAFGTVTGLASSSGGVAGNNWSGGIINYGYWNTDNNPVVAVAVGYGTGGTVNGGGGLTTLQMHDSTNFTGFNFVATPTANSWVIVNEDGSLNAAGTPGYGTLPMIASEYSTNITNAHQLQLMALDLAASYTLANDIDATATNGTANDVWLGNSYVSVGNSTNNFSGSLNGQNNTISNLTINMSVLSGIGLFGYTNAATIQNIGLVSSSITGNANVGGLVGYSSGATAISNSYVNSSVSGTSQVGGLIGRTLGGTTINNSYFTGTVSASNILGGLVGHNYGSISNSYVSGSVAGTSNVGGLAGWNYGTGTITNSFWDTITTGQATSANGVAGGTGLTTAQMRDTANWTGFNFTTTPGATGNNWVIVDVDGTLNNAGGALGGTTPMLASEYSTTISNAHQLQLMAMDLGASYTLGANIDASATAGITDVWNSSFISIGNIANRFTGSLDGQGYTINSLAINQPASNNVGLFGITGRRALIQNIGLVGGSVTGSNNVGGLVGYNSGSIVNAYNTGSVNGNLSVGGLVGINLKFIGNSYASGNVTGTGNRTGGLVGNNRNNIVNSYASGNVLGTFGTGGLAGYSDGKIIFSYATGSVTGANDYIGGLLGWNTGLISSSYATGSVSGNDYIGGLAGNNNGGSVKRSYASGNVSATGINTGGLLSNNTGTVNLSYWDTDTSAQLTSAGGTGLTTVQMYQQASYIHWDFVTQWVINEGVSYPVLNVF